MNMNGTCLFIIKSVALAGKDRAKNGKVVDPFAGTVPGFLLDWQKYLRKSLVPILKTDLQAFGIFIAFRLRRI